MKIHVEVFIAAHILSQNCTTFTHQDIANFIRKEFKDDRHGVSTHIGAACVANAPLNHPYGFNYLWRINHGEYRLFRPGHDQPVPERMRDRTQPEIEDIPEKYRYLVDRKKPSPSVPTFPSKSIERNQPAPAVAANLVVGAKKIDRVLPNADQLLRQYRHVTGCYYLDYRPITPPNKVVPEDLAVTLLLNSRATWRAFHSLMKKGDSINLRNLPDKPLEQTTAVEREAVAELVAYVAQLNGFAASVASKVLHKKRPALIPVMDNQAIFYAYMNPDWPECPCQPGSVKNPEWIWNAVNWIYFDITRQENASTWNTLRSIEPARSRIELFDSVWWAYYKQESEKHGLITELE